jgi:hypothetical protein
MEDVIGVMDLMMMYFQMLWKSYMTTLHSGTAMGVLLAQITGILLVVFGIYWGYKTLGVKKRRTDRIVREFKGRVKGKLMSATERNKQVVLLAQDAITDAMETLYADDQITIEEKDAIYEKIGKSCGWEDLLRFAQASKKEQIKRKLDPSSNSYAFKRVKLPEDTLTAKVTNRLKKFSGSIFKTKTA